MTCAARIGTVLLIFSTASCASAPRPTPDSLRVAANPRAIVEGRVTDTEGRPLSGVAVRGIPRGKDIPWSSWAVTQCDGTFRLSLTAPAHYGFELLWKRLSVITESPHDPARLEIPLAPGERRGGVDLVFPGELWRPVTGSAWTPPAPSSCS